MNAAQKLLGRSILLVDDSPDNQLLVRRILEKHGARVEVACNGREALAKAFSAKHDVVLMDIQMPILDGYQVLSALKAKDYMTPVIALTAHAMNEDRLKTHAAGFVGHLAKPINTAELIALVEVTISKR